MEQPTKYQFDMQQFAVSEKMQQDPSFMCAHFLGDFFKRFFLVGKLF